MEKSNPGRRNRRHPGKLIGVGFKGKKGDVWRSFKDAKAPVNTNAAEPISSPEIVRAPYKTPDHGFDWRSLELPVDAVALGHCGILDYFTIR